MNAWITGNSWFQEPLGDLHGVLPGGGSAQPGSQSLLDEDDSAAGGSSGFHFKLLPDFLLPKREREIRSPLPATDALRMVAAGIASIVARSIPKE
jgi:hypothetical protein